ncbi:rho GTPase-activating protein 45-like isoform X1 [Biomphalaria glabrata]|uniref:Rho GTPase-activating protein 45-like isoform X1 n=1 Tax=Biomphalaria glabrata TaxID=6526 RepID=A0A9W3AG37_BIOGL|nr:rho GTPase-activating protein 45-like isoform X1 [Biomphalaria glabrata]XP_013073818.2 rho GTPase-activating protein 45-like isoform X1 [Biomphalaria glabrata]XP_013073823.2 rho GTPase-activating protein 45-like isoform X1 [Biomphalaria glabrata]XP_055886254.1 rho GTPase-activating protein 45-like isoform X1 [Biomphalaria glabrata]XP_055886255.1 rho GTPase-activating protein 45-like isoform X1 [Biomphalaria glabrata]XP_055886256.1 rho GTPase-activating protein 45-like isoform X1 [Biomphalar
MQSVHPPKKSCSLGTITSSEPPSPSIIDHDEILALTQEVKKFSDSLARLRLMFTEGIDPEEDSRVLIHEGLGEVLSVLNPVMQNYPVLQSQDIFTAAKSLIDMIKDHNYEEEMLHITIQYFCDAIDQLALAFSSSVSDYLMGDMGPQIVMNLKTRSMNNIAAEDVIQDNVPVKLSCEEQDRILTALDKGVSLALQRAKVCSKYISDIIIYLEKKTQLEQDYAKNLTRLANTVQNSLKKEAYLPLQSVFCTALSQDVEFSASLQATQAVVHSYKIIEPLAARKMDHDKAYKYIKEAWHREHRKMTESITNLKKAQNLYNTRQQDCERAHDLSLKADGEKLERRKKAEEEAMHKAAEAETTYKACVIEANVRQQELFKVKRELLAKVRDQIQQCDQVIKEATVGYFQLYHDIMSPIPLQYQTLCDSSKIYEPGSQYAEYLRRLPKSVQPSEPEVFSFEPYVQGQRTSDESRKESFHSNGSVSDHHSPEASPVASPKRDKYRLPVKAWGHQIPNVVTTSDTDSASCSSKSHESSPSGSPHRTPRRLVSSQSVDELTEEELIAAAAASQHTQDKRSQQMKRNLTVAGEDGLDIPSLLMHRGRRNTTFGVDFQEQVDAFQSKVPPIVSKCLSEIEKRGVMIKGIYRVSGVKSKVENLCQKFDLDPEGVDLSEIHPNVISNVLKLYLRQLPEPLLTFRLYSDFIHTAKENMSGQLLSTSLIDHLKNLVGKLPASNLRTCAVLMHHLQRVASQSDFNQMSASNLGIVFGPTLLRPLEGSASLASLVDTPHQTRAIELLITYAHLIFGPSEDFELAPTQSPVEQLTQALDGILLPGHGHAKNSPCPSRKPQIQSTGSEDLPVFDPVAGSTNQPWQCESVLPGTVSQESSAIQTVAGLDLDESDLGSEDCDDLPDIILPDQSKQLSDPLNVTLSVRCIQGIDQTSQHLSPSIKTSSGPYFKPSVTKSSSTPLISNKSSLTSSDMVVALTSSAAGMASMLIMSAGTFPAEENVTNTPLIKETHLVDNLDKKATLDVSQQILVAAQELPGQEKDDNCESIESKKAQEEVSKKRLHSLQLENIKYLTRPATSQDVNTDPGLTLSDKSVTSQGVSPSSAHNAGLTLNQSDSKSTTYFTQHASSHATNESIVTESTHISVKASQSTRRSILEEMPIPTVSKPVSNVDVGADAVTIPASPTIKRREMPSKIPTSPGTQRSFDSRGNLEKVDSRADRFKQEQRKLVKAIKSDSKIGAVSSHSDRLTSFDTARLSQESPEKDTISRSSDMFENTLSGGCALSSRHSSQSEETTSELFDTKPASDTLSQSDLASQSTSSISSSKPLRSSTWTGKTESTKTVLISRQRPATSAGESSFLSKPASSRIKALNMPSTLYVKKPLLNMSTTKVSLSGTSVTATSTSLKSGSTRTSSTPKTSSDQSPQLCSRLPGNVKTSEEQSSVTASVTRKGSGRGGELSVSIKSVKTKTDNEGGLERSSTSSSQSSSPRHRHPSGDSNHHTKQAQRRHPSSSGSSPSVQGFQDKIQLDKQTSGHMGVQQVQKTARYSSQSQSSSGHTMSSSSTSVSSSTIMQSSSSSSSSGKLSQDRTPRFV